jgi:hypothetical protein
MKKLLVRVEKTSTGYSAYADKYDVYSTGKDVIALANRMIEAFNLYFEKTGEQTKITRSNLSLKFSIPGFSNYTQ